MAAACHTYNVYAIVGTPYYEGSVRYNAAVALGPNGQVVERYYRVHTVEGIYAADGNRLATFTIDGAPTTIFVCHDGGPVCPPAATDHVGSGRRSLHVAV